MKSNWYSGMCVLCKQGQCDDNIPRSKYRGPSIPGMSLKEMIYILVKLECDLCVSPDDDHLWSKQSV
jgi:hypothetical protein